MKIDGDTAYHGEAEQWGYTPGITTMRQYYKAAAITGILARPGHFTHAAGGRMVSGEYEYAALAAAIADAMVEEELTHED